MFKADGWQANTPITRTYEADAPNDSIDALQHDKKILVIHYQRVTKSGDSCPNDRPIASCQLLPSQLLYRYRWHIEKIQDNSNFN